MLQIVVYVLTMEKLNFAKEKFTGRTEDETRSKRGLYRGNEKSLSDLDAYTIFLSENLKDEINL